MRSVLLKGGLHSGGCDMNKSGGSGWLCVQMFLFLLLNSLVNRWQKPLPPGATNWIAEGARGKGVVNLT